MSDESKIDCVAALSENLKTIGEVGGGETLEFDGAGRVHVVHRGGLRDLNRKFVNLSGQSRKTTTNMCCQLIEQSNDIVAGILGVAPLSLECSTLRASASSSTAAANAADENDQVASDDSENTYEHAVAFRAHCGDLERKKLAQIASALERCCAGLCVLMNSTYKDDNDTCAELLMLITSAQSVTERAKI